MQKKAKTPESELLLNIIKNPLEHLQAVVCLSLSGLCTVGVILLEFIK